VTTYESTTVVVAGLQLFVSALGFVVVAWTLRVLVRSIDAQSSAGVAARQLEFDKVILAYPCLYKYFYQGHDIGADDPAYTRVMAATQLLANYFDGYFGNRGCISRCGQTGCGSDIYRITSQRALRYVGTWSTTLHGSLPSLFRCASRAAYRADLYNETACG
jgi:hypothetical protein